MAGRTSRSPRIPKFRLHMASGQAVVTLSGRDVYLGKHGSEESHARYHDQIARVTGPPEPDPERDLRQGAGSSWG